MEAPTRDSAPKDTVERPKDRRIPLKSVKFVHPVPVAGWQSMASQLETGGFRNDGGVQHIIPQIWLDPLTRTILVDKYEYPLEQVVYWERARAAITKMPEPPAPAHDYTIGPRK